MAVSAIPTSTPAANRLRRGSDPVGDPGVGAGGAGGAHPSDVGVSERDVSAGAALRAGMSGSASVGVSVARYGGRVGVSTCVMVRGEVGNQVRDS